MQDWLNRIGLSLQFIALFLVTPEIIGGKRVEKLAEVAWINPIRWLDRSIPVVITILIGAFSGIAIERYRVRNHYSPIHDPFIVIAGLAGGFAGWVLIVAISAAAAAVAKSKRSFFPVGAGLFSVGFVLLLWATFVPHDH